jgi:hypothetical protein
MAPLTVDAALELGELLRELVGLSLHVGKVAVLIAPMMITIAPERANLVE